VRLFAGAFTGSFSSIFSDKYIITDHDKYDTITRSHRPPSHSLELTRLEARFVNPDPSGLGTHACECLFTLFRSLVEYSIGEMGNDGPRSADLASTAQLQ
jgi:hypothetical protein